MIISVVRLRRRSHGRVSVAILGLRRRHGRVVSGHGAGRHKAGRANRMIQVGVACVVVVVVIDL